MRLNKLVNSSTKGFAYLPRILPHLHLQFIQALIHHHHKLSGDTHSTLGHLICYPGSHRSLSLQASTKLDRANLALIPILLGDVTPRILRHAASPLRSMFVRRPRMRRRPYPESQKGKQRHAEAILKGHPDYNNVRSMVARHPNSQ